MQKEKLEYDRFITTAEAAFKLGVPRSTLRSWFDQGLVDGFWDPRGWRRFSEQYILKLKQKILLNKIKTSYSPKSPLKGLQ